MIVARIQSLHTYEEFIPFLHKFHLLPSIQFREMQATNTGAIYFCEIYEEVRMLQKTKLQWEREMDDNNVYNHLISLI